MPEDYVKPEKIALGTGSNFNENWVQNIIAADPSVLDFGDLELLGKERSQPKAGRLDLLFRDADARRYEVEIQLGATDPSHIIRTIEYWDIEKKRYPQYDHCAVLVAEDVTSRFLNVISLFNGAIPFVAIQMSALKVDGKVTLVFTKVLDEMVRGLVDEDEETAPVDRAYWEEKAATQTMSWADELLGIVREFDEKLAPRYTRNYIGLSLNRRPLNFVSFSPKRQHLNLDIKLPRTEEYDAMVEAAGGDGSDYSTRWRRYIFRLREGDIREKKDLLREIMRKAYHYRISP